MLGRTWTEAEDQLLKDIWLTTKSLRQFVDKFPGRNLIQLRWRAHHLNLPKRTWVVRHYPKQPIELFMKYVEKTEGCWIWRGGKDKDGYGQFNFGRKHMSAHRASYILHKGSEDLGDLHVLHTCDNPPCVNPHHLYAGTPAQNMQDMINRNRRRYLGGENNGNAKLTNEQAAAIRKLYAAGNFTQRELALKFDIAESTVSHVVTGKHYAEAA